MFEHRFDDSTEGVYVGWAAINDLTLPGESPHHKAVLSIGWNVRTASLFHTRPLFLFALIFYSPNASLSLSRAAAL